MAREGGGAALTGLGVCSSLGDAVTACAAARAGVSRPRELDFFATDPETQEDVAIAGHPVPDLDSFRGRGRLLALGEQGLADLVAGVPGLREQDGVGLHLCLTDPDTRRPPADPAAPDRDRRGARERQRAADGERLELAADIVALAELPIDRSQHRVYRDGPAGFTRAVADALALLSARRLSSCVVGAVDSQLDRPTLEVLARAGRLKAPEEPNGLMPGEAAVFLLLERADVARQHGRSPLARLGAAAVVPGENPDALDRPPRGTAWLDLFGEMAESAGGSTAGAFWFITDQNGELFRALEWGDFIVRSSGRFPDLAQAPVWYPAVTFGDTGAASGALGVAMAARAFARDYAPAPTALVLSASYEGLRGAVRVDAPIPH